jgi:AP-3 complex subunit delta-1
LAFNQIVLTHPYLVAEQEDVILDCIDSPDMSIRLRALDLVVGMVSSENLMPIIGRLMRQLRSSEAPKKSQEDISLTSGESGGSFESDDESPKVDIKIRRKDADAVVALPDEYRIDVIQRILKMCSSNNYTNLVDFDWYIDILIQLARSAPASPAVSSLQNPSSTAKNSGETDVSEKIGNEMRNIAVKVKAIRSNATKAAESIVVDRFHGAAMQTARARGILRPIAWIIGEYASYLSSPEDALVALLQFTKSQTTPEVLSMLLQAIPKVFAYMSGNDSIVWSPERKTMLSLLMARIIHAIEPLGLHPDLEVQERAVEFTELLRLAAEASAGQQPSSAAVLQDAPLLLTQAIPSLFSGLDLHSIATGAQLNVPLPNDLDLDQPISTRLGELLREAELETFERADDDEFEVYYHQKPSAVNISTLEPAISRLAGSTEEKASSYQHDSKESYLDPDIVARRRAERLERNKDDPFYIAGTNLGSGTSSPFDAIICNDNGNDLDIDSIPVMPLDLEKISSVGQESKPRKATPSKARQRIQVAADETLVPSGRSTPRNEDSEAGVDGQIRSRAQKAKKSPLLVDSSNIGAFSLEEDDSGHVTSMDYERQHKEEEEMAKAMQEVEKLRLEMQRANERIQAAQGVPPEGTVVKKRTKKKVKSLAGETGANKKGRKIKVKTAEEPNDRSGDITIRPKKVKKKKMEKQDIRGINADTNRDDIPQA